MPATAAPPRPLTAEERQLVADHAENARLLAYRVWSANHEWRIEDLISDAQIGLISAAQHFDPGNGASFATFASHRMYGAMLDGMRDRDDAPRSMRARHKTVAAARQKFLDREGRKPTHAELAREAGLTSRKLTEQILMEERAKVMSLQFELATDGEDVVLLEEMIADERGDDELAQPFREARSEEVAAIVARLPWRERMVIHLYFWEELTLREIGPVLNVTESRVSQILTRALERLRAWAPAELTEAI